MDCEMVNPGELGGRFVRTNETKSRSMHGVGCENLSKSGAPKRIGVSLSGIVIERQTVD